MSGYVCRRKDSSMRSNSCGRSKCATQMLIGAKATRRVGWAERAGGGVPLNPFARALETTIGASAGRLLSGLQNLSNPRRKDAEVQWRGNPLAIVRMDQFRNAAAIAREKRDAFLETLLDRARRVVHLGRNHGEPSRAA